LIDWRERRLLLSLARRESYQCNARHQSDGNDLEFGFHIRRNLFSNSDYATMLAPEMRKTKEKTHVTSEILLSELIFPDEIHDLLRWSDWIRAYRATAEFFDRKLTASSERE